jgi:multiple sugar transport system substrate-binding protein
MKRTKRMIAGLLAVTALAAVPSCSKKGGSSSAPETTAVSTEATTSALDAAKGSMDIVWLSDYDLNTAADGKPAAALEVFQQQYGGKVEYTYADHAMLSSVLEARIKAGEEVDMVPYSEGCFPENAANGYYAPLDQYYEDMGMNVPGLWDDIKDVSEQFKFNGQHYVMPYSLSDPLLITYSRKMIQDEGLEDPYTLYQEGKWDWNAFTSMMDKFVENANGTRRYGINGWFGQAALISSGSPIVKYDGTVFSSNLSDEKLNQAGQLMESVAGKQLYTKGWRDCFPTDQSTLFYAMGDWALGGSNARNLEMDLMIVPFPKAPDSDKYYLSCNFNAKMLTANSLKGKAVARYIMCERYVATSEKARTADKERALAQLKTGNGADKHYITEEQYNALRSYLDPKNITPVFDYASGMGEKVSGNGMYNYETRGVMQNLTTALLDGNGGITSWAELKESVSPTLDAEIARYNK